MKPAYILLQFLLVFFSLICPPITYAGDAGVDRIIKRGLLTVGTSGNQPPFVMQNANNELIGFDIDLAKALASAMNVNIQFKQMAFSDLFSALHNGDVDIVLSGMNITLERASEVLFVGPYMMSGKSIITKSSSLTAFQTAEHFNKKELKIIALKQSTSEQFILQQIPEAQYSSVNDYDIGVNMIKNGEADVMVADMPFCVLTVFRNPNNELKTIKNPLSVEPVGIAVSRAHPSLHALVDNYLDSYQRLDMIEKLRKKWFEQGLWVDQLPQDSISL